MEFPGIGGSRTGQAVKDVRTALEQAGEGPKDEGVLGKHEGQHHRRMLDAVAQASRVAFLVVADESAHGTRLDLGGDEELDGAGVRIFEANEIGLSRS